jgi:hypothetical protein
MDKVRAIDNTAADAEFIAAAREDVPWLLSLVETLQASGARLREALEFYADADKYTYRLFYDEDHEISSTRSEAGKDGGERARAALAGTDAGAAWLAEREQMREKLRRHCDNEVDALTKYSQMEKERNEARRERDTARAGYDELALRYGNLCDVLGRRIDESPLQVARRVVAERDTATRRAEAAETALSDVLITCRASVKADYVSNRRSWSDQGRQDGRRMMAQVILDLPSVKAMAGLLATGAATPGTESKEEGNHE